MLDFETSENSTSSNNVLIASLAENVTNDGELHEDYGIDDINEHVNVDDSVEQVPPEIVEEPQLRRSARGHDPSTRYPNSEYVTVTEERGARSFQEVQNHKEKAQWMKAMQGEMKSLMYNSTYELVELLKSRKALKNKWMFKLKMNGDKIIKYITRLVVKGFN